MYKSPTDAQRRREAKKAREFWSNLLGGSKAKRKTSSKAKKTEDKKIEGMTLADYIVFFSIAGVLYWLVNSVTGLLQP